VIILLDFFNGIINKFLNVVYDALPKSFVQEWISKFEKPKFLDVLNWFVPIDGFIIILTIWLSVIATFYIYQIILRWIKVIGE
jgi:hypothetical protein